MSSELREAIKIIKLRKALDFDECSLEVRDAIVMLLALAEDYLAIEAKMPEEPSGGGNWDADCGALLMRRKCILAFQKMLERERSE